MLKITLEQNDYGRWVAIMKDTSRPKGFRIICMSSGKKTAKDALDAIFSVKQLNESINFVR